MTDPETTCLSLVLELEATETAPAPAQVGRGVHGLFFSWLKAANGEVASEAHADAPVRPFTTSPLLDPAGRWVRSREVFQGYRYLVRLTGYGMGVSWVERALSVLPSEIDLEGTPFRVVGLRRPGDHPLARSASHRGLLEERVFSKQPPPRSIAFRFSSPTTFRSAGRNVPLPLPGMVFEGLLNRWNATAPVALPAEFRRYVEECLAVAGYRLQTVNVRIGEGRQVGFLGTCRFVSLAPDPYWLRLVHLLGDFAFFSGIGAKTALGLGLGWRVDRPCQWSPGRETVNGGGEEGR